MKLIDRNNFCHVCGYPLGNYKLWGDNGKNSDI